MNALLIRVGRWSRLSTVTGLGWLVLTGAVAGWWVGDTLGWAELVLGAATAVGVLLIGAVFTVGRTNLTVTLEPGTRRIEVGRSTVARLSVVNNAVRPLLPLVMEVGENHPARPVPVIRGRGGTHTDEYTVAGVRRGLIMVGPATSVRGDPLGLLQRRVTWTRPITVFVHPVTVPLAALGAGLLRDLEGQVTNDLSMSDLAFHALRPYEPGDDRRYIHWRSSAKLHATMPGGTFLVRQFRDTRRTQLLVVIDSDLAAYGEPEDFELAVSVGASVARQAVVDDLDVTLFVGDQWVSRRGARQQTPHHVLDTCARAVPGTLGLPILVPRAVRTAPEATFVLLVTGPAEIADLRQVAAKLPAQARVTAVRVDPSASGRRSTRGGLTVHTLTTLGDLPRLLTRGEGG